MSPHTNVQLVKFCSLFHTAVEIVISTLHFRQADENCFHFFMNLCARRISFSGDIDEWYVRLSFFFSSEKTDIFAGITIYILRLLQELHL